MKNETVSISNSFTADASISTNLLTAKLGFNVTESKSFAINWSNYYYYPITIKIYPRFNKITGEIWDDDLVFDDYVGKFTVKRAVGDDIRIYKNIR